MPKTSKKTKTSARKRTSQASQRAARFAPTAKFTVTDKTNPRREGGIQHKRYAKLIALSGKTVDALPDTGHVLALRRAVAEGRAKVA